MPNFPRTDLAVEAEALRSAAAAAQLPGVRAAQTQRRGYAVTQVEVLDAAGSEALCKPIGRYDTSPRCCAARMTPLKTPRRRFPSSCAPPCR